MTAMWTASRADSRARFWAISPARSTSAFSIAKYVVNNAQDHLKGRPDGLPLVDGGVAMQDLLQHFRIRDQTLARRNQTLQQDLCFRLVRMRCSDEVHRDVGIDEDQA